MDDGKITVLLGEYKAKLNTLAKFNHRNLTSELKCMIDKSYKEMFGSEEEQAQRLRKAETHDA